MYYRGAGTTTVKPVTRRTTFARGMTTPRTKQFLQKAGRPPKNRRGYPTLGTPIALDMALEPGRSMIGPPFSSLGDSGDGLGLSFLPAGFTGFTPTPMLSTPTVTAPPVAPKSSSLWNPLASLVQVWNDRPQVLKDIKIRVNPAQVMQTAQSVLKPGQVAGAVDKLRAWGIEPSYQGFDVTGARAGFGYQLAGVDWMKYLPWIIGGGAALFILPGLMRGKR